MHIYYYKNHKLPDHRRTKQNEGTLIQDNWLNIVKQFYRSLLISALVTDTLDMCFEHIKS